MKCLCGIPLSNIYSTISYLGLPIYHCQNCGLFTTGSSESELFTKIEKFYKKDYWNKKNISPEMTIASNYTDVNSQSKRRQWISQFAYCKAYFAKKQTLLEIGSGMGQTIFWFEQEGFSVTGIEPDERNVNLINKKLKTGKCIQGYIEQLNIIGKFDIIWISHVLEHLIKPNLLLERLRENLNEGGILFIEVPNCQNDKVLYDSIRTQPHTFHFTKKSLISVAKNSKYSIISCNCFRSATIFEAILKRTLQFIGVFPHYPKIMTDEKHGIDLRLILKI